MAVTYAGNVVHAAVTQATTIARAREIIGVKYKPGTVASTNVTIHSASTTATQVWFENSTSAAVYEEVRIRDISGVIVTTVTGAEVWLYLKV